MNISNILDKLGISKWHAAWVLLTKGSSGFVILLAEGVTTLMSKADDEKLKTYSETSVKVAKLIRYAIELFVPSEKFRRAGVKTATELESFAKHIEDKVYTKEELQDDIDCIKACIELWKEASK